MKIWAQKFEFLTQITFALFVQDHLFEIVSLPSSFGTQGPFSANKANWDEQPGPPDNQTT